MQLILLIESDPGDRSRLENWLEAAGYSLMECPGPQRQDFTCLGVRGEHCALVEIADLAILDGRVLLDADDHRAARQLLHSYLTSNKPVLLLADGSGAEFSFEDDRVAVATRANRESVLQAVRELLDVDRLVA
jgi:CheY-like chemotaxis protein